MEIKTLGVMNFVLWTNTGIALISRRYARSTPVLR
jgi:hypothetical protein